MDFPPNSHKVTEKSAPQKKQEKKEITKIVSGDVVTRKKPLGQRLKNIFVGGEVKNAAVYIAVDVLVPAARNMIVDATTKGVERLIYGDSPTRRNSELGRSRISYNSPFDRSRVRGGAMLPDQPPHYTKRASRESSEIILSSRAESEMVLSTLSDIIEMYEVVSVADLNELVGLPSTHVDNKWGWISLRQAQIRQIREGYLLDLPPAKPL